MRNIACGAQYFHLTAVGIELRSHDTGLFGCFQDNRTRAVAKQHTGTAIIPVEYAGKHFCADDQRGLGTPSTNEGIGGRQRIDKAAANRLHVECRPALGTKISLHQTGRAWQDEVRRGWRTDEEVELVGLDSGLIRGALPPP